MKVDTLRYESVALERDYTVNIVYIHRVKKTEIICLVVYDQLDASLIQRQKCFHLKDKHTPSTERILAQMKTRRGRNSLAEL